MAHATGCTVAVHATLAAAASSSSSSPSSSSSKSSSSPALGHLSPNPAASLAYPQQPLIYPQMPIQRRTPAASNPEVVAFVSAIQSSGLPPPRSKATVMGAPPLVLTPSGHTVDSLLAHREASIDTTTSYAPGSLMSTSHANPHFGDSSALQ